MSNQVYVSNLEELEAALEAATGGETIILRDGDYGALNISNLTYSETVTIRSENPLGAVFEDIDLFGITNLRFDSIELNHIRRPDEEDFSRSFNIRESHNIEVINSDLHGSVDGNFDNDIIIFSATDSTNISIIDSTIHDAIRALTIYRTEGVVLSGNTIFDIRSDGFDFAGVHDVLIEDNTFTNFFPNREAGDHADGIQFFNTVRSGESGNVTIRNNTFTVGEGEPFQSIFIENDIEGLGFFNFNIEGNVIQNGTIHGITVTHGRDINITNNTVLAYDAAGLIPGINILEAAGENIVIENNVTSRFRLPDNLETITLNNNIVVDFSDPESPNFVNNLFFDGFASENFEPEDLQPRPDGLIGQADTPIGALAFVETPDELTARATAEFFYGTSDSLSVRLDAGFSANSSGLLNDEDVTYEFDFGDGNVVSGREVIHTFAEPGEYTVTLTVTDNAGNVDVTQQTVRVVDPLLLDTQDVKGFAVSSQIVADTSSDTAGLVFDGTNPVSIGRRPDLSGVGELHVSLDIRPTGDPSGDYRILWNHGNYTIQISNGELIFTLVTQDGDRYEIRDDAAGLFDGDFHNLSISFDAEAGIFTASVNGEVLQQISSIDSNINDFVGLDVFVGGDPFDGRDFVGEIRNLEIYSAPEPVATGVSSTVILTGPEAGTTVEGEPTPEEPAPEEPASTPETEPTAGTEPTTEPEPEAEPIAVSENATFQLTSSDGLELTGGASEANGVFSFDGSGLANLGRPDAFAGGNEVAISFDFRTDGASGNGGQRVFWDHARYGVELKGDTLNFRLFTDEGEFINIQVRDAGVTDGEYHNIAFTFDADTGTFAAFVDGVEVGRETGILGDLNAPSNRDITLGGSSSGRDFAGDIRDFRLFDDIDAATTELGLGAVTFEATSAAVVVAGTSGSSDTDTVTSSDEGTDDDWAFVLTGADF